MIQSEKAIHWSPAFHRVQLTDHRLLFVGEMESFLLEGEEHRDLFVRIDGSTSVGDIVFQYEDIARQATLLNAIDRLMKKGFVVENGQGRNGNGYFTPDFDREPRILRSFSNGLELRILSRWDDPDRWRRWARTLNITEKMSIVIVDDYLDPRLGEINRIHLGEKRPWMLLKPTGEKPLIGPCFSPGRKEAPCWQCLATRLGRNQPVRRWLERREGKNAIPLPTAYDEASADEALAMAARDIRRFPDRMVIDRLRAMNSREFSFETHVVGRRPQCPRCGDPDMFGKRAAEPVRLQSCFKAFRDDGGSRATSPDRTLRNLTHLISPLTGVVNDLNELPGRERHGVTTYRSSFFKTPFFTSNPGAGDFMQISLGKGLAREQSKVSALCESIERFAAQHQGDEPRVYKKAHELDARAVSPGRLVFFSEQQLRRSRERPLPGSVAGQFTENHDSEGAIHWTPCWSMTRRSRCYIPFSYCYANTPHDREAPVRYNSNGCSAGNTLEEAILQGFCELVERDAIAIWWYNRTARPSVRLDELNENNIRRIQRTLGESWEYWVLDATHDFKIPVMAAAARHKKRGAFRLGFGCHPEAHVACNRALTELCQLIAAENKKSKTFDFNDIRPEAFLFPDDSMEKRSLSRVPGAALDDIADEIRWCMERADRLGLEVLVNNTTRPDVPVYTVKVIIPGLCHIWPQFGNKRLYEAPVAMGWREKELTENELNPMALFV